MFGRFTRLKGSDAIAAGIQQFEQIAEQLEQGAADNHAAIEANTAKIRSLAEQNCELASCSERGAIVARKLRELVAG